MLQQSRDPLAILDIGLPPRHRLDVLGIDEEDLDSPLQDLVDRSPVDAGALHRDVRAFGRRKPVGEPEQFVGGRPEGANLLRARSVSPGTPQAGRYRFLCTSSPQQTRYSPSMVVASF
jgi:hypothetical protein